MPSAFSPVPGPTSNGAAHSSTEQATALAAAVLPMPISPPMNSSVPTALARNTLSRPACKAARPCSTVMAGPSTKLAVPAPIRKWRTPGKSIGDTVPRSTTSSCAESCRASTLMAAPPLTKLCSICPVTSCGYADTPSATTPWSPAKIAIHSLSAAGRSRPCSPASCTAKRSSCASEPAGLVSCC
ncbi:methyltransferase [Pseudomonas syringae pv. spinaceae]|uniref:Methyltransferase n=1 Tax=Pseudomonas syringae pv. spinaceae TaxID=264459 RepID=A0A0Q0BPA3_PSESX|nr:methyltransferase [Pseudomonas syringae pv. spinaceae]